MDPISSETTSSSTSDSGEGGGFGGGRGGIESCGRLGKKITTGEGEEGEQQHYEAFLPGCQHLDAVGEDKVEMGRPLDPCTFETEEPEDSCYEAYYAEMEYNQVRNVSNQVDDLIKKRFKTVDDIKEPSWMQAELFEGDELLAATPRAEVAQLSYDDRVAVLLAKCRVSWVKDEEVRIVMEAIKDKLEDFGIESRNLLEIKAELENLQQKKMARVQSLIGIGNEGCCAVFEEFPLPNEIPCPTPAIIMARLPGYQNNESFKRHWKNLSHLSDHESDEYEGEDYDVSFPKMMQFSMDRVIHAFPNGIAKDRFWIKFQDFFKYIPVFDGLGLSSPLADALTLNEGLFYTPDSLSEEMPTLLFPACMKGKSLMSIIKQYHHAIKIHLASTSQKYLESCDVHDIIKEESNFEPDDWRMDSSQFVALCIKLLRDEDDSLILHTIYKEEPVTEFQPICILKACVYVCVNARSVIEEVESYNVVNKPEPWKNVAAHSEAGEEEDLSEDSNSNEPASETDYLKFITSTRKVPLLEEYVCDLEEMDGVSNHVSTEGMMACEVLPTCNCSPENFAIHVDYYSENMDDFFTELANNELVRQVAQRLNTFPPNRLRIGQYVLAKQNLCNDLGSNWCRGRVTSARAFDTFEIYLVDHGCKRVVDFHDIRLVPEEIFTMSKSFAVPCRLRNKVGNPTYVWSAKETSKFQDILDGKKLVAAFHSSKFDNEIGCKVWEVSLKYTHKTGRWINIADRIQTPEFPDDTDSDSSTDLADWANYYKDSSDSEHDSGKGRDTKSKS